MAAWDWYECTVRGLGQSGHDLVLAGLVEGLDLASVFPGRAMHGYLHGAEVRRGDSVLATVWWGGNPGVHVKATGGHSPEVSAVIRERWPVHAVTRFDACVDFDQEGLFDQVAPVLLAFAAQCDISINQQGDWHRGQGRTLYLGAVSSPVRLVVYEKGYELGGGASLNLVRFEVRVRPKGDARERVASWEPASAFSAAGWLVGALERIGWDVLTPQSVGTVWRPSDAHRARLALVRQYGPIMSSWIAESGGLDAWWLEFLAMHKGEAVHTP
jgi:hypothetical protein